MASEKSAAPNAAKVARSILTKNLKVKAGERVTIEAWPHTLPWAIALAREARRLKALPMVLYEDEDAYWDAIANGQSKILGTAASHEWAALGKTNVYIHMWGPGDRVRLNAVPEKRLDEAFRFNDGWYAAARKSGLRGLRLELGRPFPTLSVAYDVDQQSWLDQIAAASLVPPEELERRAAPIAKRLRAGRRVHITHPNGTDLTLGLARRPVYVYSGRPAVGDKKRPFDILANLPAGSVRTSLDESVADGTIVANRTCYYDDGSATGAVFEFAGGKLKSAKFDTGAERFDGPFAKARKGRDQPGFLSFGLNPELHNTPQVEDLEAGTVMVSVGGNRNLGGKNAANFFGWAIVAGAKVEIDGKRVPLPH